MLDIAVNIDNLLPSSQRVAHTGINMSQLVEDLAVQSG
jgi:hypothetical protein